MQSDEGPLQRRFHPSGVRTLSPSTTTNISTTPWLHGQGHALASLTEGVYFARVLASVGS